MSESVQPKEPCRFCETPTRQRAEGIPYCSMDCVEYRRKQVNGELLECPYPDCDWFEDYRPENGLSRSVAYHRTEKHRQEHKQELEANE